jgi:serine protease Do
VDAVEGRAPSAGADPTPSASVVTASPEPGDWLATPGTGRDPIAIGVVSVPPRPIEKQPGFLGVGLDLQYKPGEGAPAGVRIDTVTPDGAALEAGLQPGDLVVRVDGAPTPTPAELKTAIAARNPGDRVEVEALRGEAKVVVVATLRGWAPNPAERRAHYQNRLGGELSERRFGFPAAMQHDTVLAPTECGGPLVDIDGRVVGLNISRAGRTESYALPAEVVAGRLLDLMSGRLAPPGE